MEDSLDSTFYDTVTALQQTEALENAISILQKWRELAPLAEPLERKRRSLLSFDVAYTDLTDDTDHTHRTDAEGRQS